MLRRIRKATAIFQAWPCLVLSVRAKQRRSHLADFREKFIFGTCTKICRYFRIFLDNDQLHTHLLHFTLRLL